MSEDVSPALRTEMPHLIANEAAAKFAARERAATAPKSSPRQTPLWEQDRPSSHSSHTSSAPSYASYSSQQSTSSAQTQSVNTSTSTVHGSSNTVAPLPTVRLPTMISLRDQLHHFRKELNNAREDSSRVYPMSEGLSGFPRRVAQHDGSVLDARGGSEAPRLMERCFGDVRSAAGDRGSEPALMKTDQPDVVASARHSVRAQSEMHKLRERENSSPPLEELAAAALKASQFD
ncbi:unnamed protein product [Strongylus vulgaris]|uniref:Uncharacterized protein n=1 Tax=Strongylus vulgaris TaxID=40348 RepID=A0A3P7ILN5_STRVU|nr:unnamed protein product [Strongylus vulgaris]